MPAISGFCSFCRSNRTNSCDAAVIGQRRQQAARPMSARGRRGSRDSAGANPPVASGCRTEVGGSASCGPPAAAERRPVSERRLDGLAPVLDLDRGDDPTRRLLDDGHAGRLRSGVDLDPVLVDGRSLDGPILEDDREREIAGRSPLGPWPAGSEPVPACRDRAASGSCRERKLACVFVPQGTISCLQGDVRLGNVGTACPCSAHRSRPSIF